MIESEDKLSGEYEKESPNIVNADDTQDEKAQAEQTQTDEDLQGEIQSEDSQDERKNAKGGKRKVVMQKVKTFFNGHVKTFVELSEFEENTIAFGH